MNRNTDFSLLRKHTKLTCILLAGTLLAGALPGTTFAADGGTVTAQSTKKVYSIGNFMSWMLQRSDLTDAMTADIKQAQTMLSDYKSAGYIKTSDTDDAVNLDNIKEAIEELETVDTYRKTDENYNGYIFTSTPTLYTNFTMMVGSAYTADVSATSYSHVSSYYTFASNECLAWGGGASLWYKEKTYFDKYRKQLGYTAPVTEEQLYEICDLASDNGYVTGHYTNLFYAQDQIMGIGYARKENKYGNKTVSANATSLERYTDNGYAAYTIDAFKSYFSEYYISIYGEDPFKEEQNIYIYTKNLRKTFKAKKLKKKKKTFRINATCDSDEKLTYKKISGNKKITISKNGKVTVKKGLKKKTYKVKVRITAPSTDTYRSESVTKTIVIKVK